MAKCSQCLHWDACSMLFELAIGRKPTANGNKAEEKCPHFKDKTINTNADRIRAMSDEELARWVLQFVMACCVQSGIEDPEWKDGSEETMIGWLKQPAEGE